MIGNKRHYIIVGATGLVGSSLLEMLLNHQQTGKVTALSRRSIDREHPKLEEKIIDFNKFTEKDLPGTADAVFCCLGTTIRKAGDKATFRMIDYEYVVKLAVFTQRARIGQFHVISAAGANARSRIFYNQVKGRMENEVQKLSKLHSIYIYRPSMLLGNRNEFRLGESVGKAVMKVFDFLIPKRAKAIHDAQVAYSMLHHSLKPKKGVQTISNKEMLELSS